MTLEKEPTLADAPLMAGKTLYQKIKDKSVPIFDPQYIEDLIAMRGENITFTDIHNIPSIEISDKQVRDIEPLVSVAMITYNHEHFISEAIESIIKQKVRFPFELIIGEDCSTDKTRDIVLDYQKKYPHIIRVLIAKNNLSKKGYSNELRVKLSCRGKYIAFCEGDDYWNSEDKLQKQVDIAESQPEIGCVFAKTAKFYQTEKAVKGYRPYNVELCSHSGIISGRDLLRNLISYKITVPTATVFICADLFLNALLSQPFFLSRLSGTSTMNLMEVIRQGKNFYYIDEQLAVYRVHDGGISNNSTTMKRVLRDGLFVRNYYLQYFPDFDDKKVKKRLIKIRFEVVDKSYNIEDINSIIRWAVSVHIYSKSYGTFLMLTERTKIRHYFKMTINGIRHFLSRITILRKIRSLFVNVYRG